MKTKKMRIRWGMLMALALSACTSTFEPRMSGGALEAPLLPTAKETHAGVNVSVEEYFSSHKSRRAFDADVGAQGVLPLLVHVDNRSGEQYRLQRSLIHAVIDGHALADIHGLEAAEIGALRNPAWNALINTAAIGPLAMFFGFATIAGSATQTQKINRQIEHHFERIELVERIVKPNETASGFVFFKMPPTGKSSEEVNLEIILEPESPEGAGGKRLVYHVIIPKLQLHSDTGERASAWQRVSAEENSH